MPKNLLPTYIITSHFRRKQTWQRRRSGNKNVESVNLEFGRVWQAHLHKHLLASIAGNLCLPFPFASRTACCVPPPITFNTNTFTYGTHSCARSRGMRKKKDFSWDLLVVFLLLTYCISDGGEEEHGQDGWMKHGWMAG
jgi:hypothetical protein